MKQILPAAAGLALLLAAGACDSFSNRGTVERPEVMIATCTFTGVEKVELTDSSTVLHFVARYRPNWWIQIDSGSCIEADGKSYPMISADGIPLGEHYFMPDSGVVHFSLTYPAIPSDVRAIDYIGRENDGNIYGIRLGGDYDPDAHLAVIPKKLRKQYTETVLPEPNLALDSATVNIHLVGYRPEMGDKLKYYYNGISGQVSYCPDLTVDSCGNAVWKGRILGPVEIFVMSIGDTPVRGQAYVSPSESIDLYVDMSYSGIFNTLVLDNNSFDNVPKRRYSYSDGIYGQLSAAAASASQYPFYSFNIYSGKFCDYGVSEQEYVDHIISRFEALSDSIDAADMPELNKALVRKSLEADLIDAAADARKVLVRNYYYVNQNYGAPIPEDSIISGIRAESARRIAAMVDLNDPLLYYSRVAWINELASGASFWKAAGVDVPLLESIDMFNREYKEASAGKLSDSMLMRLRALPERSFAEAVEARKAEIDALSSRIKASVSATPDVPADRLFEAITAPHKGKVVVVDLWNTWCGPCRAALKQSEPDKTGELSSDDIVWIYIADDSSDADVYLQLIKDIKGLHYKVSKEQIATIRKQFGVDGIPYYILVDRKGKAAGRPDLRDHGKYKTAILELVNNK